MATLWNPYTSALVPEELQLAVTAAEMPASVVGMPASVAATVEMPVPRPRVQLRQRVQPLERGRRPQPLVRQPSRGQLRLQPLETAGEAGAAAVLRCKFDLPRRQVSIPLL